MQDFETLYPDQADKFKSKWHDFAASIVTHASSNVTLKKIKSVKLILDQLKDKPKLVGKPGSEEYETSKIAITSKYSRLLKYFSKDNKIIKQKMI